jgi:hypothetical protein
MHRYLLLAFALLATTLVAQNSNRKIRARPSKTAAQAGSAVKWREDVAAAMKESAETKKPVFWYIPTLSGSPMDRKPEIDRYMMAGPFSWPRMIKLLNESFIPVRVRAWGADARKYGITRNKFIEPGYLVIAGDGKELLRLDQLTTFHPEWMMAPLARVANRAIPEKGEPSAAQKKFFAGVRLFESGASDKAIALWKKIGEDHPDDPFGWKAAAEAEGHGPFRFGFEVFRPLPASVMTGTAPGSRAPDGVYAEKTLRKNSLDFLCRMQLANGGWEDSRYDFGGTDSLPNVYTACTAIIASALLEELNTQPVAGDASRIQKALDRAIVYINDDAHLNFQDRDELIWAHIYRTYFFCRFLELRKDDKAKCVELKKHLTKVVKQMFDMQPGSGCWFHEYSNAFVCADVLFALDRARSLGIKLDDAKVSRGNNALMRCRAKTGSFSYSFGRRPSSNVKGAAGRMPLCELALLKFGRSEQKHLERAVAKSFTHHDLMDAVRKYDDHASRYGYGGFFFWFDMLGRSRAIRAIEDEKIRNLVEIRQRVLIVKKLPEIDGCFIDSHELGRTYGTAMALLCLAQLRR